MIDLTVCSIACRRVSTWLDNDGIGSRMGDIDYEVIVLEVGFPHPLCRATVHLVLIFATLGPECRCRQNCE